MTGNSLSVRVAVVVPTIRESSIQRFILEWATEFKRNRVHLFVVEDNSTPTFRIPKVSGVPVKHFSWRDIDSTLGRSSWIISRRSSAIKSFGFFAAYKSRADVIISLDDDCYPLSQRIRSSSLRGDFIRTHVRNLYGNHGLTDERAWFQTTNQIRPRGLPYRKVQRRPTCNDIVISHGLWANVPDVDAKTQLSMDSFPPIERYIKRGLVPIGQYFPMCGMNLAWRREVTPLMYFMLMGSNRSGKSWGYDRFDDIWAGIIAKKVCDHLGKRVMSGEPIVWHDRASNARVNLRKERSGMSVNEDFWSYVDSVVLTETTPANSVRELARKLKVDSEYLKKLKRAMSVWSQLFR